MLNISLMLFSYIIVYLVPLQVMFVVSFLINLCAVMVKMNNQLDEEWHSL